MFTNITSLPNGFPEILEADIFILLVNELGIDKIGGSAEGPEWGSRCIEGVVGADIALTNGISGKPLISKTVGESDKVNFPALKVIPNFKLSEILKITLFGSPRTISTTILLCWL